jgi:hypothetical protein
MLAAFIGRCAERYAVFDWVDDGKQREDDGRCTTRNWQLLSAEVAELRLGLSPARREAPLKLRWLFYQKTTIGATRFGWISLKVTGF